MNLTKFTKKNENYSLNNYNYNLPAVYCLIGHIDLSQNKI